MECLLALILIVGVGLAVSSALETVGDYLRDLGHHVMFALVLLMLGMVLGMFLGINA